MDELIGQTFPAGVCTDVRGSRLLMACLVCGHERWLSVRYARYRRGRRCMKCAMTKHGHARRDKSGKTKPSRLYNIWRGVKHRCFNTNSNRYQHYGARGITMHAAWVDDFEAFAKAVGQPPSDGHSLDRIDVNGNYEPGNVRWATAAEQNANRRTNSDGDDDDWNDDFDR